jgi:superfamily II DNA or RNA helicase
MSDNLKYILDHICISNKGVSIYKNKISDPNHIETIKDDLTIAPYVCPGYGNEDDIVPYKLYIENTEKLYVPYYYAVSTFGVPKKTKIADPYVIDLSFASDRKMRPYQEDIIKTYMTSANKIGGGIISVGCGRGKTVMALKILEELKVKTLILVHKEFLMNQWVERIGEYLPDAKIGYIQGKTLDIRDKDIVLAMIQSLSDPRKDKDYPPEIFEGFGLVIADECHHMAARQFCRALAKYTFKYTLGLSATPNRADGLAKVFKWYLGDIVYKDAEIQKSAEDIAMEHIPNSTVQIYQYRNLDIKYCKEELNYKRKPNIVNMKTNISKCLKRTKFLLSFIPKLIEEGRTILILSSLRNHITLMQKLLNDMAIPECTVGLYVGGMKQCDLDESAKKRVIIATFNMAEEAFDCKTLNTLIYATPHKNIEQAVGRILREEKKKRVFIPLIIDLQDMFSSFKKWNTTREKYYLTKGYPMTFYDVDETKPDQSIVKEIDTPKRAQAKTTKQKSNSATTKGLHNDGLHNDNDYCVNTENGENEEESSSEEETVEYDLD